MRYKTVIWDMDGVLVDSERHWDSLDSFFLEEHLPGWDNFDTSILVGRSFDDIYEILTTRFGFEMDYKSYRAEYDRVARDIYGEKADLMPGVRETIEELDELGVQQAVASSSFHEWIEYALNEHDLRKYFKVIVSAEDVEGKGKPDPAIYLETLRQLRNTRDSIIVVEDSGVGVQSAHKAGLTVIGYGHDNNEQDLADADVVVEDLLRVVEIANTGIEMSGK